ncbi:ABC transporter substrate-binding protein [Microlunatus sp. Gsoil 973]|uniref:ABC transporter substrate-binding protein n=1 Tax=Microlunatus sp. Gsoil 973 TaxID=2672569 RepID=UPI0012B48073|nr:extracellular solute-binding protein [Microlunatus sp. Gsoil 973]QGN33924.1 extracellular solute-binding protein [Microlunatus sp. Gsoil 973]
MGRRIKSIFAGLVAGGLAAVSAACGGFSGGTGANGTSGQGGDGVTTVSLMTWANPQDRKLYQESLDKLTEKSGIKIKLVYVGSGAQYYQKINSMVLSNTLPDIFWCANLDNSFQPLAASGKLYDWTSYVDGTAAGAKKAPVDKARFGPGYLDQYEVGGKQYGVPNEANTYGVFYNADLFRKAGLELPSADWTWDDLFTDMKKLTITEGGKTKQYGMQTGWGDLYDPVGLSIYSISNGGNGLAAERTWKNVSKFSADAQLKEGATRWSQAIRAGEVTDPDFTGTNTWAAFINGQVPMVWGGQWNAVAIFDGKPTMSWGYAPIPGGSAAQIAPLEANAFCSPVGLKNPDATWQVISYMLTTVFNEAYAKDPVAPIAYVPGSKGYLDNLRSHGAIGKQVSATVEQELQNEQKVGTGFLDPWAGKAGNLTKSQWNPMLQGKKPVGPTLDAYAESVNKLIKAN